jgi:hypothetical protein
MSPPVESGPLEAPEWPAAPARCQLGVLFVHGIGRQRRGEALVQGADAIVEWTSSWISGFRRRWGAGPEFGDIWRRLHDGEIEEAQALEAFRQLAAERKCRELFADATLTRARLQPDPSDLDQPATARLALKLTGLNGQDRREEWLFAESHWADAFLPPTFAQFARWALQVIPWTLKAQFATRLRRQLRLSMTADPRRPWTLVPAVLRPVLYAAYLVGALAMAVVVQALLLLLLVVAAIPIGWIRELLLKVQQGLASSLGDSFVLLQSQVQCIAIVDRVRRDIDWIAGKARAVVVIAHSQGAAVAHMALREDPPPQVRRLVTVGSGLGKLYELRALMASGQSALGEAWLMLGCLVVLIVLGANRFFNHQAGGVLAADDGQMFVMYIALLGLVSGIVLSNRTSDSVVDGARDDLRLPGLPDDRRWVDFFTSADPVPNGRLFDEPQPWLGSREVFNTGSAWSDHTTYWRNQDGFVGLVVAELAEVSALPLACLCVGDADVVEHARWRRRWRVRALGIARLVVWPSLFAIVWHLRAIAPDIGAPIVGAARWAILLLPAGLAGKYSAAVPLERAHLAGWVLLGLGAVVWYGLVTLSWRSWERHDLRRLFAREHVDSGGLPFVIFVVLGVVPPLVAVGLSLPWAAVVDRSVLARLSEIPGLFWSSLLVSFLALAMWDFVVRSIGLRLALSTLVKWRGRSRLAARSLGGLLWLVGARDPERLSGDLRSRKPMRFGLRFGIVVVLGTSLLMGEALARGSRAGSRALDEPLVVGTMLAVLLLAEVWARFVAGSAGGWLVGISTREPVVTVGTEPSGKLLLATLGAVIAVVAFVTALLSPAPSAPLFSVLFMGSIFSAITLRESWRSDRLATAVAALGVAFAALATLAAFWTPIVRVAAWLWGRG